MTRTLFLFVALTLVFMAGCKATPYAVSITAHASHANLAEVDVAVDVVR